MVPSACYGGSFSHPEFVVFLTSAVNVVSLLVYAAVVYQFKRLSANHHVTAILQRQRQVQVAKLFAWIALSDLLLEVIPNMINAGILTYHGSSKGTPGIAAALIRFNAALIMLNRCINLLVYLWKFPEARYVVWQMMHCHLLSDQQTATTMPIVSYSVCASFQRL